MHNLIQDLRYALRVLAKSPGFAAIAVITLALGIGANTAVFSVINGVLLRPLPFHEPERLVALWQTEPAPGNFPLTGEDYLDWQSQNQMLEATSLYGWQSSYNVSVSGEAEPASGVPTEANFFSVLGVSPLLGRTFAAGEDSESKGHVAVLSYGFWQRHLGGRAEAIGKSIQLNGETYTVVGIMPRWFRFPSATDLWIPMDVSRQKLTKRGTHNYRAIARLKPGVGVEQARADLVTIAARLEKQYPSSNAKVSAVVVPLKENLVGDSRPQFLILLGAVALVLLVGCANVANLLLARATGRSREIAVRTALGASRGRILQQLLTESMLLALGGAALGILGAEWFVDYLSLARNLPLPQTTPVRVDGAVLLFTLAVSVAVGILFGLAPALHASELNLSEELKASAASVVSMRGRRRALSDALVIGEIALSLALLLGAGLLLRSFAKLRSADIGVQPENVLTARIVLPQSQYKTLADRKQFYDQLVERLRHTAGIQAASVSSALPLEGGSNGYISIQGDMNPGMANQLVEWDYITPEYFRVFGIPLLQGRSFTDEDMNRTAEVNLKLSVLQKAEKTQVPPDLSLVVVINRTMARDFWPNQDPVGKIFKLDSIPVEIIGVVGDVKQHALPESPWPEAYFPLTLQLDVPGSYTLELKTGAAPAGFIGGVRGEVHRLDAALALFRVRTMKEIIAESMQGTTYQTILLSLFAGLALVLAAVGIYGVMAYRVTQRTHEIGVRMALGAEPQEVLRLILGHGAGLALAGIVLGVLGSLALARLIRSLLFGVSAADPATYAGMVILLAAVALAACYVPARRAARVDPIVALRYE